jgi:hypothetical protein
MEHTKRFLPMLVAGCLLLQSTAAMAQVSRPDDDITKLRDDVYLFRYLSQQNQHR